MGRPTESISDWLAAHVGSGEFKRCRMGAEIPQGAWNWQAISLLTYVFSPARVPHPVQDEINRGVIFYEMDWHRLVLS
jgi:hypothetical protein